MRVVGEDGLTGRGSRPGDGPGVRARLRFPTRARRIEQVDEGAVFWISSGEKQAAFRPVVLPRRSQVTVHLERREQRIFDGPRPRVVTEDSKFERQPAAIGFEIEVNAAGIGGKDLAVLDGKGSLVGLSHARHAQAAGLFVGFEGALANDLGEFSGGETAKGVHLPHAILRRSKALQEDGVFPCGGFDVRNAERVSLDAGAGGYRSGDGSRCFRKGPPTVPPDGAGKSGEQNGYAQVKEADETARTH